jgi:hypothetical protein
MPTHRQNPSDRLNAGVGTATLARFLGGSV